MVMDLHGDPLEPRKPLPVLDREIAAGAASMPSSLEQSAPRSFDVKKMIFAGLRRFTVTCILTGLLVTALGGIAVERKFRPSFAAESYVYVAPLEPRILHADEEWHKKSFVGFYDDYVRTLARRTVSHRVLARACRNLDEQGVRWLPDGVLAGERENHLRARLQVNRLLDTHLLGISLEDSRAEIPAHVVNAVSQALLRDLEEQRQAQSQRILKELKRERDELRAELETTYSELDGLSEKLGSAILDERQNIFYERIQVLEEGLTKIFVRRVAAEGALASTRARAEELRAPVPIGDLERDLDLDVRVKDGRVMIARRIREIDDSLLGLGPKHPHTSVLGQRRAVLLRELSELEEGVRQEIRNRIRAARDEEAASILAEAERELAAVQRSEKSMKSVLAAAKDDLADHGRAMFEGSRLRAEARRLLTAIEDTGNRMHAVETESIAPARCSIREEAREPSQPTSDRRRPLQAAASIFGLISALGLALTLEMIWRWRSQPRKDRS
jgi:uncharacterized protein involved in exopolysaccharide biosynthesis